jgi:hypothetical protein
MYIYMCVCVMQLTMVPVMQIVIIEYLGILGDIILKSISYISSSVETQKYIVINFIKTYYL